MEALEGVPCVSIFPEMKPWAAWVHFHRKYSNYRHELNHAQPAGASGAWEYLYVPFPLSLWNPFFRFKKECDILSLNKKHPHLNIQEELISIDTIFATLFSYIQ